MADATNDIQTAVRLPTAILAKLDALAKRMSKPGLRVTRTEIIRMFIVQGLEKKRPR